MVISGSGEADNVCTLWNGEISIFEKCSGEVGVAAPTYSELEILDVKSEERGRALLDPRSKRG